MSKHAALNEFFKTILFVDTLGRIYIPIDIAAAALGLRYDHELLSQLTAQEILFGLEYASTTLKGERCIILSVADAYELFIA